MDHAAEVVIGCLDRIAAGARPLVVDEETGALAAELHSQGTSPLVWQRRATRPGLGTPWPAGDGATSAFVRLPKAKDALDLALHAAASLLQPGAPMVLFGANDEGIRSANAHLASVTEAVATLDARRHCRVLAGNRAAHIAQLKASLDAWQRTAQLQIGGKLHDWVSYPGVFAHGGLDAGTAMLIAHMPAIPRTARVLDFAAGAGVLSAAVLDRTPSALVDMLEIDTIALEAARRNVPAARPVAGCALSDAPASRYDLIISNPPIHDGVSEDHAVLRALIAEAPERLSGGGHLLLVVQRRLPAQAWVVETFGACTVLAEDGRFRVLTAQRPEGQCQHRR